MLPSRQDLAEECGVAVNTLQSAMAPLIEDGTLRADSRRGTFVARSIPLVEAARVESGRRQLASLGMAGGRSAVKAAELGIVVSADPKELDSRSSQLGWHLLAPRDAQTHLPHLFCDQWAAGYAVGEHLLESGYRRLLFIRPYHAWWIDERIDGVKSALRDGGNGDHQLFVQPPSAEYEHSSFRNLPDQQSRDLLADHVVQGMKALKSWPDPRGETALIAPSGHEGLQMLEALRGMGLRLGSQVGLVGFDDVSEARQRGLSSVRPPMEEMGEVAARMLLRALEGEPLLSGARLSPCVMGRASTSKSADEREQGVGAS